MIKSFFEKIIVICIVVFVFFNVSTNAQVTNKSIDEIIQTNTSLKILSKAINITDLKNAFNNEARTLFAPTDLAFSKLPSGILDKLLLEQNRPILIRILNYHSINNKVEASQLESSSEINSIESSKIKVTKEVDKIFLNTNSEITSDNIQARNGIIHIINNVLLPPGLDLGTLIENDQTNGSSQTIRTGNKSAKSPLVIFIFLILIPLSIKSFSGQKNN